MNFFCCSVSESKHSQAKTLKTISLGNIEKAGMVRINIKYWTRYWTSKLIQVCFYFLWQVPELIEEYSQSLEDIMASQVPGGESGEISEIEIKENQVKYMRWLHQKDIWDSCIWNMWPSNGQQRSCLKGPENKSNQQSHHLTRVFIKIKCLKSKSLNCSLISQFFFKHYLVLIFHVCSICDDACSTSGDVIEHLMQKDNKMMNLVTQVRGEGLLGLFQEVRKAAQKKDNKTRDKRKLSTTSRKSII